MGRFLGYELGQRCIFGLQPVDGCHHNLGSFFTVDGHCTHNIAFFYRKGCGIGSGCGIAGLVVDRVVYRRTFGIVGDGYKTFVVGDSGCLNLVGVGDSLVVIYGNGRNHHTRPAVDLQLAQLCTVQFESILGKASGNYCSTGSSAGCRTPVKMCCSFIAFGVENHFCGFNLSGI